MMPRRTFFLLFFVFISLVAHGQDATPPKLVPDEATAVKIAEKALIPIYGKKRISAERPFGAVLKDGVWMVTGTLHCPNSQEGSGLCAGGVAMVRISQVDGRILSMGHGK